VLQRILSCENPLSAVSDGWVNLIEADWDLETVLAQREEYRIRGIASGAYDSNEEFDELIEVFPAIEGCTEEDVGWMTVDFKELIPTFYVNLDGPTMFDGMYVRPPDVAS
jgi:hypothetical protein